VLFVVDDAHLHFLMSCMYYFGNEEKSYLILTVTLMGLKDHQEISKVQPSMYVRVFLETIRS
jgi:hypothetical protein